MWESRARKRWEGHLADLSAPSPEAMRFTLERTEPSSAPNDAVRRSAAGRLARPSPGKMLEPWAA